MSCNTWNGGGLMKNLDEFVTPCVVNGKKVDGIPHEARECEVSFFMGTTLDEIQREVNRFSIQEPG